MIQTRDARSTAQGVRRLLLCRNAAEERPQARRRPSRPPEASPPPPGENDSVPRPDAARRRHDPSPSAGCRASPSVDDASTSPLVVGSRRGCMRRQGVVLPSSSQKGGLVAPPESLTRLQRNPRPRRRPCCGQRYRAGASAPLRCRRPRCRSSRGRAVRAAIVRTTACRHARGRAGSPARSTPRRAGRRPDRRQGVL